MVASRLLFWANEIPGLERKLNRELQLPWVTHTLPQESVEIKEAGRRERILIAGAAERVDEVIVIERIEHLDHRDQLVPFTKSERPRQTPIEREIVVVFAQRVPICRRAGRSWRSRLS